MSGRQQLEGVFDSDTEVLDDRQKGFLYLYKEGKICAEIT